MICWNWINFCSCDYDKPQILISEKKFVKTKQINEQINVDELSNEKSDF